MSPAVAAKARIRPATSLFIVVWLGWHMMRPCYYYLMEENPLDERFAWRMFSDIDAGSNWVEVSLEYANGTVVTPKHKAEWFGMLGSSVLDRQRNGVKEAATSWICAQHRTERLIIVRYAYFYYNVRGEQGPGEMNLCEEVYC